MNSHTIRTYLLTMLFCLMGVCHPLQASSNAVSEDRDVDIKEVILDHIGDAYEWHIMTWGGHHISIPLPVIVFSQERGFHTS